MLPIVNSFMSWYLKKRIPMIEYSHAHAEQVQYQLFEHLLSQLKITKIGKKWNAKDIFTYQDYTQKVPLHTYDDLKTYIQKTMDGEQNILWPTDINWFAKSSGTTSDKSKFIPVSFEAMDECQFKGSRDVLAFYYHQNPNAKVFQGKGLIVGGSHQVNAMNKNAFYGDLSAVMMNNLPFIASILSTPSKEIALMDNWEVKLEKMVDATINEDVTNISGVPTWTLLILKRLLEKTGKKQIHEVWPNLELYVHGGISFKPYQAQFNDIISPSKMNYRETYNASEGFFGVQDEQGKDMLLMLDYGIFYEFIPIENINDTHPKTIWIDEIELNKTYAVVLNTNAGLWRYQLGDTIRFTSKNPYRIQIVGRTKLFINAFGEELMIDNAEMALTHTQAMCNCAVTEYTAAPIFMEGGKKGGHEWYIEFEKEPEDINVFIDTLDAELKKQNSDYEAKRQGDLAILKPTIRICPKGTFYKWMKERNKLGGQNKIPRLFNDRTYLDDLAKICALS